MVGIDSTFSSARERRLWLWLLATLVAIYSTLGPARTVADTLRDHNLLRVSLALLVVLLVGPVVWRWVRTGPDRGEIGAALGVGFAYWMVAVRLSGWEERTHLIEYGVVAALIHLALLERARHGRRVPMPAVLAVTATAALGLLDECVQALVPGRVFDVRDVFFNALAGFMVVAARLAIQPQSGPGWRIWFLWLMAAAVGWGEGMYRGWFDRTEPSMLESTPTNISAGYLGVVVGACLAGVLQWLLLRRRVARAGRWLLASVGAVAIVGAAVFGVGAFDTELGWIIGVSSFGTVVGLLQWSVLRHEIPRAGLWVLASTAGWVVGMPLGDMNGPPALGAAYGAVTATALVWLLRQPTSARRRRDSREHSAAMVRRMFTRSADPAGE